MHQKRFQNLNKNKKVENQITAKRPKIIHEKLSNENIYKSDIKYQMNKNLNFENLNDEENSHRDISERFGEFARFLLPFIFLKYLFFSSENIFHILSSLLSLCIVTVGIYIVWNKDNKEKLEFVNSFNLNGTFNTNIGFFIRVLFEFLFFLHAIHRVEQNEQLFHDKMYYFSIINLLINLILDISMLHSLVFYTFQGMVMLAVNHHQQNYFFVRFVKNVFSFNFIIVFFIGCAGMIVQYCIKKGIREIWALYDSFKRSYFIFKKSLFDEYCYPVFVISKKTNNNYSIYYKNQKANDLIEKVKLIKGKNKNQGVNNTNNKNSGKNGSNMSNFLSNNNNQFNPSPGMKPVSKNVSKRNILGKNIKSNPSLKKDQTLDQIFLDKELEELFDLELKKLIANKNKFFDFPLKTNDKRNKGSITSKQGSGKLTFFDGNFEEYDWYRVVVSPCLWKNQEAFYVQFLENNDYYINELTNKAISKFSNQFSDFIDNIDKLCGKVVDAELSAKEKLLMLAPSTSQKLKNTNVLGQSESSGKLMTETFKKMPIKKQVTMMPKIGVGINSNNQINLNKDSVSPIMNSQHSPALPVYDYSLWLFFKYNTNYLYDTCLTIKIYNFLLNKIYYPPHQPKTKIRDVVNYFNDYFFIPCKIKNVKFNFIFNLIEEEFYCNHYYVRCILFNIFLFIINNSNDNNKEKLVDVTIKSERDRETSNVGTNHTQSFYLNNSHSDDVRVKFLFQYKDEKPKISLTTLAQVLVNRTKGFIDGKKNFEKVKICDIGLLAVYYLLNLVYDNDLLLQTDLIGSVHTISFYLKARGKEKMSPSVYEVLNCGLVYQFVKYREPRRVFECYYSKILQKVYKIIPPVDSKVSAVKGYLGKIESNKELKKGFPSVKGMKKDVTQEDSEYDEKMIMEDMNVSIENDKNMVKETNYTLSKHFENNEKLIYDYDKKTQEKSKIFNSHINTIRFLSPALISAGKNSHFSVDSNNRRKIKIDGDRTKLRYFYPPRFLIVEDNAFGRISLIENLKKQKLIYLIDIAAYGWESFQKFKFFLNKGYMYDIIFMDINLQDMKGSTAAKMMRQLEEEYPGLHTNIVAVSVEGQKNVMCDDLFDVEKPIKGEEFPEYIVNHFKKNRPDVKYIS